jgi:predicted glutamine amidotransferase
MCRLLLCVKENINEKLINKFLSQSINKKNTPGFNNYLDANYHKDGYGFVYWSSDKNKWYIYKSDKVFVNDINIDSVIDSIVRLQPTILIGHLRNQGRCVGSVNINNVHPFLYNNYAFVHNGYIKDFSIHKEKILNNINNNYKNQIIGETDTEHIFYLLLTIFDQIREYYIEDGHPSCELAYFSFIKLFEFMLENKIELVGNFIFSNGKFIIIIRYISENFKIGFVPPLLDAQSLDAQSLDAQSLDTQSLDAPSLYFNDYIKQSIISSEPLLNNCKIFDTNSYLIIRL